MSFPRYPEYKASGVEWLGDVPGHWGVIRLKRVLTEPLKYGANESAEIEDRDLPRFVRITDIDNDGGLREETFKSLPREIAKDYLLEEGDMLLARSGATVGKSFMYSTSWGTACFAGYLIRARLNRTRCFPKWLFYYCQTNIYWAYILGNQIQSTIQNVSAEKYANLILPIPSPYEQQAITNFLDLETAKIDGLIEEQRRLVELLKEKRQAVISHAVTKGLNPNAPMKPSGIEWLGDIPEHWVTLELKRMTLERCDGPFGSGLKSEHYTEFGVRVVRLNNIRMGYFDSSDEVFVDTDYYSKELNGGHDVITADLLIAGLGDSNNTVGRACVAPDNIQPAMVKADCFRFRLDPLIAISDFVAVQLTAGAEYDSGLKSSGSTRMRMPLSITSNRIVALPPLSEQKNIFSHINSTLTTFNALISEAEKSITLLQERRTALISAAVTGKIDVRGLSGVGQNR